MTVKKRELIKLGMPPGEPIELAIEAIKQLAGAKYKKSAIREAMRSVATHPESYLDDELLGPLAKCLVDPDRRAGPVEGRAPRDRGHTGVWSSRAEPAVWRQWGENLDPNSIEQMERACRLPVAVAGALMPDAHVGYGLPIGGVLATDNAVIPYAVGVDIACRMKLSVLDLPIKMLDSQSDRLAAAIEVETRFGVGVAFKHPHQHEVMDADWSVSPVTRQHKDKAWKQLGTSGSGNHFVEFGIFSVDNNELDLEPGEYLALLSHSGSRGTGALVADHYSKLARRLHPELPKELSHLAWLEIESAPGREYWAAMELMGRYAAANHALIHQFVAKRLGAKVLLDIENHHNFAWREKHFGKQVVVHRKGAIPAQTGVQGIIPGSMASPAYVVRGKGHPDALDSAAHGAGRVMSRKQAKKTFTWHEARRVLREKKVKLISAGLDEVPMVYKNIDEVMQAQTELVEIIARFDPRLVKMAPAGQRPEG